MSFWKFCRPASGRSEAWHFPDPDPHNNRANNLQWGTHKDNISHKAIHGTQQRFELHHRAKLSEELVIFQVSCAFGSSVPNRTDSVQERIC